jgi:hypothetical protein
MSVREAGEEIAWQVWTYVVWTGVVVCFALLQVLHGGLVVVGTVGAWLHRKLSK